MMNLLAETSTISPGGSPHNMRILLVEDNLSLAEWMTRTLRRNKFAVDCAYNGADADHLLRTQTYELVILGLSPPRLDGHPVRKQSRAESLFAMHDHAAPDAIEIYVSRLRRKLEHSDAAIITLRGLGYLLKQRHAA